MTAHLDGGHARLSAAPAAAGAFLSVGMAFASERRQIGPEAEEHMSQQEGRMDLFGRTIAIAERHVERLSEQVGTTPVPPELVREAPDSLAATPDQLYAAAEAALRTSEARFRDLVEGSLQGVIIVRHFKPLFLNSAYAAMFGYTPRELLALDSTMVLFTPHERQRLRGYHEARLRGEPAPTHYEF